MKLPRPFVLQALLLVACLSVAAYPLRIHAQAVQPTPELQSWGDPVDGVQLRLAVSKNPPPYAPPQLPGDLPHLEMQIRNMGTGTVTFSCHIGQTSEIEIDGTWYEPGGFIQTGTCANPPGLEPGNESANIYLAFQYLLMNGKSVVFDGFHVGPGKHVVRVKTPSKSFGVEDSAHQLITLMSNTITINIPDSPSPAAERQGLIDQVQNPQVHLAAQDNRGTSETLAPVPFVGCKSDTNAGPADTPTSGGPEVRISARFADRLAWYAAKDGPSVLAPRGWTCIGYLGSAGPSLDVTPPASDSSQPNGEIGIHVISRFGDTSGRFDVAKVIARVFPTARSFAEKIDVEGQKYGGAPLTFAPFETDSLRYQTDRIVEYETRPGAQGLGTLFAFKPSGLAIRSVAILKPEVDSGNGTPVSFDLAFLALRLPGTMNDLEEAIVRQFERRN